MDYKTKIFGFGPDKLTQFAEPHTIERTARIEDDRLIMESEIDRRILRREELPQDGPQLETGYPLLDWAFLIARRDLECNFYEGGIYAGANFRHTSSWIRDTSYVSMMGVSCFYPEKMAKIFPRFLDEKLGEIQYEQYRGYYEDRYFSMTDHILWVLAVEKLCRVTGDDSMLVHGARYAAKTISRILNERLDRSSLLIAGGSSLFDGPTGFPDGFTGPDLRSCSTHLLYLRALKILEDLDGLPDAVRDEYRDLRAKLAEAIDRELWLEEDGYYAQLHHGECYREERLETLGNLMALGNPDISPEKAERITAAMLQHPYGLPALFPWYENRIVYHSESIWPFMMGVGLWALRERGEPVSPEILKASGLDLTYITAQILRTSMLEGTFMELLHARTGQGRYSPAQIWSVGAMFAIVENGIFGMRFHDDRLVFKPELPDFLQGRPVTLRDIVIRGKSVTLSISPDLKVSVDGHKLADNTLVFADWGMLEGKHDDRPIEIPTELYLNAEREADFPGSYVSVSADDWTLRMGPEEITVFPADEQAGSYGLTLQVTNESDEERTLDLRFGSPGAELYVTPNRMELSVKGGETISRTVRLGFEQPPVGFGGGLLRVGDAAGAVELEVPIRRFLTLDMAWRYKPMFKQKSLSYGREFKHYDYWDVLRAPMHADFRMGPYQGILWYAKKVMIPANWSGEDLVFYCGAMSDWDVTYFNGTVIGRTGSEEEGAHGAERRYTIPAELVKPGEINTLAVQVYCPGEKNGMYEGPLFLAKESDFEWAKSFGKQARDANYLPPMEQGGNDGND